MTVPVYPVRVNCPLTEPEQMVVPPETAPPTVTGSTVIKRVEEFVQLPLVTVYTTVTLPGFWPVKVPSTATDAVPVPGITDQDPPGVELVNAEVTDPEQTTSEPPVIGPTVGRALTVRLAVAAFVQPPLVTV
jgi:hypothetical protein